MQTKLTVNISGAVIAVGAALFVVGTVLIFIQPFVGFIGTLAAAKLAIALGLL